VSWRLTQGARKGSDGRIAIWLGYDSVAFAVFMIALSDVELLVLGILIPFVLDGGHTTFDLASQSPPRPSHLQKHICLSVA